MHMYIFEMFKQLINVFFYNWVPKARYKHGFYAGWNFSPNENCCCKRNIMQILYIEERAA